MISICGKILLEEERVAVVVLLALNGARGDIRGEEAVVHVGLEENTREESVGGQGRGCNR